MAVQTGVAVIHTGVAVIQAGVAVIHTGCSDVTHIRRDEYYTVPIGWKN